MLKQEFDRISRNMGYGPCADNMFDEIERMYSAHDDMTKEAAVYIYWNKPGVYREILDLREKITKKLISLSKANLGRESFDGYSFLTYSCWLDAIQRDKARLTEVVKSAIELSKKKGGAK